MAVPKKASSSASSRPAKGTGKETTPAPQVVEPDAILSGADEEAMDEDGLEQCEESDIDLEDQPFSAGLDADGHDSLESDLRGDLDSMLSDSVPNLPQSTDAHPTAVAVYSRHLPGKSASPRDSLHSYLKEVNRFPLLKPEEEQELAQKVKATGDPDAAFRLVSSHLRLVVRIALDFQRRWMQNVLDLIQEGNVGLVRAVSKFDPDKGIKFSYYASFWIKAYILKFIMDNWRLVKIGTTQAQRKLFYNLNRERQQLIAQGFDPDTATLAQRLDVSEEQIIEMEQRLDAPDVSLDTPVNEADSSSQSKMDFIPALGAGIEDTLANRQMSRLLHTKLQSLLPKLSDKEQYILANRLLTDDPVTLREIGDHFSITRERVRQIEARLLQKVRDHLVDNIQDFSIDWIQQ